MENFLDMKRNARKNVFYGAMQTAHERGKDLITRAGAKVCTE
jgi:hypothetical protein